ncbi:MAG: hypothetical protein WC575_03695 [Patescibacteria group bacterium]
MRKKFFQKQLNGFLILLIISGFLFPSLLVMAAFDNVAVPFFAGEDVFSDTTPRNLTIFNASRGFFLLPLSANGIPDNMPATDNPTIALPDTIILSDTSNEARGLVIYRVLDGALFVNTFVGKSNESAHSASYFGIGDFVMVTTVEPDQCAELTLNECRADVGFLNEKSFSISLDGSALAPTIDIIDSGAVPDNNSVSAALPLDSASVVPTPEPDSTPAPVIQQNEDGSTTLIAI